MYCGSTVLMNPAVTFRIVTKAGAERAMTLSMRMHKMAADPIMPIFLPQSTG